MREKYPDPETQAQYESLMVSNSGIGVNEMMVGTTDKASSLFKTAQCQAYHLRDDYEMEKSIYLLPSAKFGVALWTKKKCDKAPYTLGQAWELTNAHENTRFA